MLLDLLTIIIFLALFLVALILLRKIAKILLPVLILAMVVYALYRLGFFNAL